MLSFILVLLLGGFMPAGNLLASDKEQNPHYITVKNSRDLQAYFRYAPDRPIVISGHRGGMLDGYPENCIESFEKTLSYMESFFRDRSAFDKRRDNRIDARRNHRPDNYQGKERFQITLMQNCNNSIWWTETAT